MCSLLLLLKQLLPLLFLPLLFLLLLEQLVLLKLPLRDGPTTTISTLRRVTHAI
jgi:hypothetical protein